IEENEADFVNVHAQAGKVLVGGKWKPYSLPYEEDFRRLHRLVVDAVMQKVFFDPDIHQDAVALALSLIDAIEKGTPVTHPFVEELRDATRRILRMWNLNSLQANLPAGMLGHDRGPGSEGPHLVKDLEALKNAIAQRSTRYETHYLLLKN